MAAFREKLVHVSICPPQILNGLAGTKPEPPCIKHGVQPLSRGTRGNVLNIHGQVTFSPSCTYPSSTSQNLVLLSSGQLACQHDLTAISWNRFKCAVGGVRHPQHTQTGSN
jgi:hypothetical protein